MKHKPVIFIDFKKNSRLCKNIRNGMLYKDMISMLLTFLKTHFHIVYILGNFFQKSGYIRIFFQFQYGWKTIE